MLGTSTWDLGSCSLVGTYRTSWAPKALKYLKPQVEYDRCLLPALVPGLYLKYQLNSQHPPRTLSLFHPSASASTPTNARNLSASPPWVRTSSNHSPTVHDRVEHTKESSKHSIPVRSSMVAPAKSICVPRCKSTRVSWDIFHSCLGLP